MSRIAARAPVAPAGCPRLAGPLDENVTAAPEIGFPYASPIVASRATAVPSARADAGLDPEGHPVDGDDAAKADRQVSDLEGQGVLRKPRGMDRSAMLCGQHDILTSGCQ